MNPIWIFVGSVVLAIAYRLYRGPTPERLGKKIADAAHSGDPQPFRYLTSVPGRARRVAALGEAHRLLEFYELHEQAEEALALARGLDPRALPELSPQAAFNQGEEDEAILALQTLVRDNPDNAWHRVRWVRALIALDRLADAEQALLGGPSSWPELKLVAAELALAHGDEDQALALAEQLRDQQRVVVESTLDQGLAVEAHSLMSEAAKMADHILLTGQGQEALILDAAARGDLDPRAGVNYKLLGQAAMVRCTQRPPRLTLQAVGAESGAVAGALDLLREGRLELAKEAFFDALQAQPGSWPAMLGLGAAMVQAESWCPQLIERIPEPGEGLDAWTPVVPDLPMLNERERKVVAASLRPFAGALEGLIQAGAQIRILPIDVRPTDLPEMAEFDQERTEDHRALRGIGGLATPKIACSRIEDLGDVASGGAWVFAHELAHLVFFHMPEAQRAQVEALFLKSLEAPHIGGHYQRGNSHEFFAVGCEDYLHTMHGSKHAPELDDLGITQALFEVFRSLESGEDYLW